LQERRTPEGNFGMPGEGSNGKKVTRFSKKTISHELHPKHPKTNEIGIFEVIQSKFSKPEPAFVPGSHPWKINAEKLRLIAQKNCEPN